jgi:diguanylate cyclase
VIPSYALPGFVAIDRIAASSKDAARNNGHPPVPIGRGRSATMVLYTYNLWLVLASILIALMATFTGLSLTRGLSAVAIGQRQLRIVMAAIALGGGIWSMHFVAMLAMRFGVPVYYEMILTIASALIAILLAGVALLIMHFAVRTRAAMAMSGAILGIGIVVMHYVGLSAMEGCVPVYTPASTVLATTLAVALGIAAIAIAYGRRTERNLLLASIVFGTAVAVVHFSAMLQTTFLPTAVDTAASPQLDNAQIAVLVLLSVFVISGAFLLSGASFMIRQPAPATVVVTTAAPSAAPAEPTQRLPYERDNRTHLVPFDAVLALHAEGHYTTAWLVSGPVFCPWSITQAEQRLPAFFVRVHRSWIVNIPRVAAYERAKDHGYCVFQGTPGLTRVPVARTRTTAVREALGL